LMTLTGRGLAVLILIAAMGCARRRVILPDLAIPVSCAAEITLLGCDATVSPPKCRSARVKYRKGCEEIVVRGEERGPHRGRGSE
jgi:hypothetical protein